MNNYWDGFKPQKSAATVCYQQWMQQAYLFRQLSYNTGAAICLWDAAATKYLFFYDERNLLNHDLKNYLEGEGVHYYCANIHPDYLDAVLTMQQNAAAFCKLHSYINFKLSTINLDFLYKKGNGSYFHMLAQTHVVETNAEKEPLLYLSFLHDISHLKKAGTTNMIINSPCRSLLLNYNFIKKDLETVKPVSPQEKNILMQLKKCKDSKTLADELHLSTHTIDTHRRNLLKKTNCIDTTALVTFTRIIGFS